MTHSLTAVVPFCSLDLRFFNTCVKNLLKCNIKVVAVFYDRLYGGGQEDLKTLLWHLQSYIESPNFTCVPLSWWKDKTPLYFEATARTFGLTKSHSDYTLFIDPDEIVDPVAFKDWLDTGDYLQKKSWKLRQYGYLIQPTYRIHKPMYNTVLCETKWAKSLPFTVAARWDAYWNNKNLISRWTGKLGINMDFGYYRGEPFIHHYTSVRSLEEMQKKVKNWSHAPDRPNWKELVDKMYQTADSKKIGGLTYDVVENKFNIDTTGLFKI